MEHQGKSVEGAAALAALERLLLLMVVVMVETEVLEPYLLLLVRL